VILYCTTYLCLYRAKAHLNSVNTLQRACEAAARHGQIAVLQWLTVLLHTVNDASNTNSSTTHVSSSSSSTSSQQQQQAAAAAAAAAPLPIPTVAATTASSSTSSSDTPHSPGSRVPPAPGAAEPLSVNRLADTDNSYSSSDSSSNSDSSGSSGSSGSAAAAVRTAMIDKAAATGQLSTLQWIAANMRYLTTTCYMMLCCTLLYRSDTRLYALANETTLSIGRSANEEHFGWLIDCSRLVCYVSQVAVLHL
jgi:hypothetical protein